MARRIPARGVFRLRSSSLSFNAIAAALHASKASISVVLRAASEHDVAWEEAERMSVGEMYARLFPEREQPGPVYPVPAWDAAHSEFAKICVTFRFLHGEYRKDVPRVQGGHVLRQLLQAVQAAPVSGNVVNRVGRNAGRNAEVDWPGLTCPRRPGEYLGNGFTSNPVTVK